MDAAWSARSRCVSLRMKWRAARWWTLAAREPISRRLQLQGVKQYPSGVPAYRDRHGPLLRQIARRTSDTLVHFSAYGSHTYLSQGSPTTSFFSVPRLDLPHARLHNRSASTPLRGSSVWPGCHHTHLSPVAHSKGIASTTTTHTLSSKFLETESHHDSPQHSTAQSTCQAPKKKKTIENQQTRIHIGTPPRSTSLLHFFTPSRCSLFSSFRRWRWRSRRLRPRLSLLTS